MAITDCFVTSGAEIVSCSFGSQDAEPQNAFSPQAQIASPNLTVVLERRRGRKACKICHDQKAKCSGEFPRCERCSQRNIVCQYSPSAPTIPVDIGPDKAIVRQYIDAFFEHIYPIPGQSFLHRSIFLQNWSKGAHSPHFLQALCGATARFLGPHQQAGAWIQEAEEQVLKLITAPSLSVIETLLIIIFDRLTSRKFDKVMALSALVVRFALALRLNYTNKKLTFVGQERRRRLMWSIFMSDTLLANGRADFTLISVEKVHLQLPCHERNFSYDIPVETEFLKPDPVLNNKSNIGMMGFLIRILEIRVRIQKFTHEMVDRRNITPQAQVELDSLANEVQQFSTNLPPTYLMNQRNFLLRAYTPERTTYIMLHVWWNMCYCDLYRFTIPGFHEALPDEVLSNLPANFLKHCRERCLQHAVDIANIFASILNLGRDLYITDTALAICALQCARIIISLGPLVEEKMERGKIIEKSTACSDILQQHSELYPTSRLLVKFRKLYDLANALLRASQTKSCMHAGKTGRMKTDDYRTEIQPSFGSAIDVNLQLPPRQVYTKHSFLSEISQMADTNDLDELLPPEGNRQDSALARTTQATESQQARQTVGSDVVVTIFPPGMEARQDLTGNFTEYDMTWMLGPEFAMGSAEYDVLMDPYLRMHNGVENGPWDSEGFPCSDQNDTFYF
ncbi:uncharacterized protein RCO7_05531 [Rhynchosporium graminicola]|uniref:Zn(2)-C6 fungal-type domain-containing protein n=1 Tax=Rhynchosporium graminicola TaxID=2792576 RepID=A0A1E1L4W5_9HELO|nr:uncharacterized protein RCO7_05531 [Rhynchosporium commune]